MTTMEAPTKQGTETTEGRMVGLLRAHLQNPLMPLKGSLSEEIRGMAHFPLREPKGFGGLTAKGKAWLEEAAISSEQKEELTKLSGSHAERARIDVQAVILTCWLFSEGKKRELSAEEDKALKGGIHLSAHLGTMQTVKKGGRLLTDNFESMMSKLHRALKRDGAGLDGEGKNPHWRMLRVAAKVQARTKEQELKAAQASLSL
jgi:hypothetical protein